MIIFCIILPLVFIQSVLSRIALITPAFERFHAHGIGWQGAQESQSAAHIVKVSRPAAIGVVKATGTDHNCPFSCGLPHRFILRHTKLARLGAVFADLDDLFDHVFGGVVHHPLMPRQRVLEHG